jgi:hypothetical protein
MVGFLMKRNGLAIFVRQAPILSDKRHFCQTRSPFVRQAPFLSYKRVLSDKRHFCQTSAIFVRQAPFLSDKRHFFVRLAPFLSTIAPNKLHSYLTVFISLYVKLHFQKIGFWKR